LADAPHSDSERPGGIPGSVLPGPYPVGLYAEKLRTWLRERARVQLFGEMWNLRTSRAKVYFELRDVRGAVACSMWRTEWEKLDVAHEVLVDGARIVVAGGLDYYPGTATSSPSFSFEVLDLRVAGEGDLLAQLERLRRALAAEGLFEPQKRLPRPALPRAIGVVTGETGKARDDVLAGLRRRGWAGRLVWAFAPVQDRHAAPRIVRALQDLAACGDVDVIVVARGGGSLADLFAFCDETLCRTVALLPVPVIASVGHHTDRTLIDDVAAVSCSTPTHAAEAAVLVDCAEARTQLVRYIRRLEGHGRRAVLERARTLSALARAPGDHVARQRRRLHQHLRELRASARRRVEDEVGLAQRSVLVLRRKAALAEAERARGATVLPGDGARMSRAAEAGVARRRRTLDRLVLALGAHDPERTLERGYALVERPGDGEVLTTADSARAAGNVSLRFHDGRVRARVEDES
jgi:exodeoxyribonuclease VII large subunit